MSVTKISDYRGKKTVEVLRQLLREAEKGQIQGIAFAVRLGPKHHGMGLTGEYHSDPLLALAAVGRITYRLHRMAEIQETDDWIIDDR